jgi:hypothetical protein
MLVVVAGERLLDLDKPVVELFLGPRIQRWKRSDDSRDALRDDELRIGDDEKRRALAQRKADVVSRKPAVREPAREKTQAPAQPKAAKRKLSFHEKHALEMLPGEMAKMQADVRRLQAQLADPNLYGRDRAAFTQATNALTQALGQLASAEERWLELEILREEMGE